MSHELSGMVDGKRIVAADGMPVPAAPHSEYPGDHYFANCLYDVAMASKPLPELYEDGCRDALEMLRRVCDVTAVHGCVSVTATVYGQFPVPARNDRHGGEFIELAFCEKTYPRIALPSRLNCCRAFPRSTRAQN